MGFFKTIPQELEDAALIDGCSRLARCRAIVFPISVPGILTVVIFSFSLVVNEFVYAITFISSSTNRTLTVGVPTDLIRGDLFNWPGIMAAPDPEHPAGARLQRVPQPLHRRLHRRSLPLATKGGSMSTVRRAESPRRELLTDASSVAEAGAGAAAVGRRRRGGRRCVRRAAAVQGPLAEGRPLAHHLGALRPGIRRVARQHLGSRQWGEKNDVQVNVEHINNTLLDTRAAAEVAAQSGHDLFFNLHPWPSYEDQVINHAPIVQEVTAEGRQVRARSRQASTYNPKTKKYFAFSDNYVPDPVVWRHDLWNGIGESPARGTTSARRRRS